MAGNKSRIVAVIFTILLILISMVYGPVRSLTKLADTTVDSFFKVENGVSISEIILRKTGEAEGMIRIALNSLDENDYRIQNVYEAIDNINVANTFSDVEGFITSNNYLDEQLELLYTEIDENKSFSNSDFTAADHIMGAIDSYNKAIDKRDFNKKAESYNKAIVRFPASIYANALEFKNIPLF